MGGDPPRRLGFFVFLEWWANNIALFALALGALLIVVATVEWFADGSGGVPSPTYGTYALDAFGAFFLLGALLLPGALVHLVLVALLPGSWARWHKRAAAVLLSPVIGILPLLFSFRSFGVLRFGGLTSGVIAPVLFGVVVRLRE
jgi:hypothetical protein